MHRRKTAVMAAMAAIASILASTSTAAVGPVLSAAVLQRAIDFRVSEGLTFDLSTINSVANGEHTDRYGTLLTLAEADELDRRQDIGHGTDAILPELEGRPWFGGLWMDNLAGGQIVVATSGTPDLGEGYLLALLPKGAPVHFQPVTYSLATLSDFQTRVASLFDAPGAYEIGYRSVGIDQPSNSVVLQLRVGSVPTGVGFTDLAKSPMLRIEYVASDELDTCTSRTSCPNPMKGGLSIQGTGGPIGGTTCTSGFMGRSNSGNSTNQFLTAGHCLQSVANGNWYHNSKYYGPGIVENYFDGSYADFGVVRYSVGSGQFTTQVPANYMFGQSTGDLRHMTSTMAESSQTQNTTICRAGQSTGYDCGVITALNRDVLTTDNYHLHHQWQMDTAVDHGDSGGPVFWNFAAVGIISSSVVNDKGHAFMFYGTMPEIRDAYGWRPCYVQTSPC